MDFIEFLKTLTDEDRIFWQQWDFGKKEKCDIAYFSPWMICLDTDNDRPILQIAKSYKDWAELKSPEYSFGPLMTAIAGQCHRFRQRKPAGAEIAEEKIKKFTEDKLLHEKAEMERRAMIISQCLGALKVKTK